MSMRKSTLGLATVIILAILSSMTNITPVAATVPEDMHLTYDFGSQTLAVNVSHYVANTKTHYIETIEILKNGFSVQNTSYNNQSFNWGRYDTFTVSAAVGDNLTVTAFCSKGYSLTRWLVATSGTATNPPSTDTTTSTTEPTESTNPSGTTLGPNPMIGVGVAAAVAVFLIVFFAWLNPDKVPGMFRQVSSRLRTGLSWFGEKVRGAFSWLKTGLGNLVQQIKTRSTSE
ncbi:MAG: hypothetical protein EAX87_11190 [Candidatus Thorarchaeota archaeon]|nr:hypothetical protein [Candidatus Thorarchaeota archaeon]